MFIALAEAGIRQGSRPDRESERLQALNNQGRVLVVEMARLELSWHSLSSGVNWKDLNHLSDSMVVARRDSLGKAQPSALKAAAADMNFEDRLTRLAYSTSQVGAMSQLLDLFQASQWSEKWGNDLYRAAEMVSPSASKMTRAYRNSAFTLIRLKNAEHLDAFVDGAFVPKLKNGTWPGEKVADILPGLRREVGKFSKSEVPGLLAGTLQLYKTLADPIPLIENLAQENASMETLEGNPAVLFDPQVYRNYLERLRYQAGLKNPVFYAENERPGLNAFEAARQAEPSENLWQAQLDQQELPFLKRWARHEKKLVQQTLLTDLSKFDETWDGVWQQAEKLHSLATRGHDWTAVWVDLDQVLNMGLAEVADLAKQDPAMNFRLRKLQALKTQVGAQRALQLKSLTVRLDQDYLPGSEKAVFEFQVLPDGKVFQSEPFNIGPAAPAGSGWVGTAALAASVPLSPHQSFRGAVRSLNDGRELLNVEYPSLSNRVGPGALGRPRSGEKGSLLIKTENSWWRDIQVTRQKETDPAS